MTTENDKLKTPIQYVKGVGERTAKLLKKLQIKTVRDMIWYLPIRYDDRRSLSTISGLTSGKTEGIIVNVVQVTEEKTPKKEFIKATLKDETGRMNGIWFNQPHIKKIVKSGKKIYVKGKIETNPFTFEKQIMIGETEVLKSTDTNHQDIVPVYGLTTGIHQQKIREIVKTTLAHFMVYVSEYFPESLRKYYKLETLPTCLTNIHYPQNKHAYITAHKRLIFDELFFLQLPYVCRYQHNKTEYKTEALMAKGRYTQLYVEQLPYTLTGAQQNVLTDIERDIQQNIAMNRLIQGDVGSGKTDIAILTLLMAIQSQKSGALLVPTEILAHQHLMKLKTMLEDIGVEVILLTGKLTKKEKTKVLERCEGPNPTIIVGTHALIEDQVTIAKLGVVVVDEQHRFGVCQRLKLQKKGAHPHCLYLTATPIPRTLTLTLYGDLDKSIIDEMPPGRKPVKTYFTRTDRVKKAHYFCQDQLDKGKQIYIVYPIVEDSEHLDLKSATQEYELLRNTVFSSYSVGLIHGQMKADEKKQAMDHFKSGKTQILVATTVIEVGIDVPNANTILIMHAQRYGLSQLHQLRGRVGRGQDQSYCFLIGDPKTDNANKRLKAMLETHDGFKLAESDLQIRGPGDILGTRQSGESRLNIANLTRDEKVMLHARDAAIKIVKQDPTISHPRYQGIKKVLREQEEMNISNQGLN